MYEFNVLYQLVDRFSLQLLFFVLNFYRYYFSLLKCFTGVQLTWNGAQRHLEVRVPGSYQSRTCGLCGNFNNFPQDDLRLRNSRITTSDTTFGNHWKVDDFDNKFYFLVIQYNNWFC